MSFTVSLNQSWFLLGVQTLGPGAAPQSDINRNIDVTVYPDWYKRISLDWKIPPSWGNCFFHVYFWPGGNSSYERLTSEPVSSPSFLDTRAQEYSKYRNGFYVVEALLPGNTTRIRSLPTSWKHKRRDFLEKRAAEIQRREYLLLSKFAGVKSYLFRRKAYGLRCHRCWSKVSEKIMDDRCPVCLGTSFEGGYFDAVPMFMQFEPTPNNSVHSYLGKLEPNQIGGWTISLPEIAVDDVIIRTGDWNAYRVIRTTTTEIQTNTVRQMLVLSQLDRMDIENSLAKRSQEADIENYLPQVGGKFGTDRFPTTQIDSNANNDPAWFSEQNPDILPEKYKL